MPARLRNVDVSLAIFSNQGQPAANLFSAASGHTLEEIPEVGSIICRIPHTGFVPGQYRMNVFCTSNGAILDWVQDAAVFQVHGGDFYGSGKSPPAGYGSVLVPHAWEVRGR